MRLLAPPFRFLFVVLGGWIGLRAAYLHWPEGEVGVAPASRAEARPAAAAMPLFVIPAKVGIQVRAVVRPNRDGIALVDFRFRGNDGKEEALLRATVDEMRTAPGVRAASDILSATPAPSSRWSGYTYLFRRDGSGQGLAAGGQLGGSQVGARIAYRITAADAPVRVAAAARVAAPLRGRGADAAVGVDVLPIAGSGFRMSIERRIALDRGGRDAFSAYAAGGFYREPAPGLIVDGYGQAGLVGLARRDLFADGALRLARRIGPVQIGGGAWGAAQPGVSRIDIGPRVAATLPIGRRTLTVAAEWRLRVAGNASPGNGLAFTLATDF